jgi:hypothetical protein
MKAYLTRKDVWSIIDGSEVQLPGSPSSKLVRIFVKKQLLAQSEIILGVEPYQIPHLHEDDPIISWENLHQVHIARGFTSCLTLRCCFLTMKKDDTQSMQQWIAAVKQTSQCLSHTMSPPSYNMNDILCHWLKTREEEEIILVLTNSLDN